MPLAVAMIDANVFYGMTSTDLMMELAHKGLFIARWTDLIHDEWVYRLQRNRPDIQPARRRQHMDAAIRDALVVGFEQRIPALGLPDPNDRHVTPFFAGFLRLTLRQCSRAFFR
jgi:hypothetical protein